MIELQDENKRLQWRAVHAEKLVTEQFAEIERLRARVAFLESEARIGADRLLIASGVCREWADRMRAMDGNEPPPCPNHPTGREVDAAGKRVCSTCGR